MTSRPLGAGAVLLAACLAAGPSFGAPPAPASQPDARTEKAREHYLQGDAYYKLDKYQNALQEYEQAYLAKPDPSFLYNIAQCHRLMGARVEAIRFYRRYLKDAPNAPNREVAEKHIRDLEAAGTEDTRAKPVAPVSPPAPTLPPATAPAAAAPGASNPASSAPTTPPPTLALNAPPPTVTDRSAPGARIESSPSSSDESQPIYTKWWFWTGVGAVVAGTVLVVLLAGGDPSCPSGRTCR